MATLNTGSLGQNGLEVNSTGGSATAETGRAAPVRGKITARIDAITRIPPEYRSPTPPIPRSVKIELTARCDFNCFFCATAKRLREKADIDRSFYERIVREMRDAGVEELGVFYLGESMLCPWLPEAIRFAKAECGYPYVFLTTNGRLASPERLRDCMAAGLDSLKFSFNNADPEQFQEVTRVKASEFHTVVANIRAARRVRDEGGFDCGLYASSIRYDGEQLARMERAVEEIRPYVDEHYWLPLYGQAGLTSGANGTRPVAGNPGRLDAMREPIPCWAVFTEGHVTYDGRLSACCFDHDGRFNMGDLTRQSFREAWHSAVFRDLRAAHLGGDVGGTVCQGCIAYQS
jgi:MoaA/NifB/PqqE/SkfB family radical SAM enzyme